MSINRRAFIEGAAVGILGNSMCSLRPARAAAGYRLKITLVETIADASTGSGSDNGFSIVFPSGDNNNLYPGDVCNASGKHYNIRNNSVLFDQDLHPEESWHLEIWADKCGNLVGNKASNIGAILIQTDKKSHLHYNCVKTGRTFRPGADKNRNDCIDFRMENSGASYKMLMKWEYQGQLFVDPPMQGWN